MQLLALPFPHDVLPIRDCFFFSGGVGACARHAGLVNGPGCDRLEAQQELVEDTRGTATCPCALLCCFAKRQRRASRIPLDALMSLIQNQRTYAPTGREYEAGLVELVSTTGCKWSNHLGVLPLQGCQWRKASTHLNCWCTPVMLGVTWGP
jgi:hypothetical protein